MRTFRMILALALLAPFTLSAQLGQPGSGRALLESFSGDLETLHAQFSQDVISSEGIIEDSSSGEVWLQRPRQFRWAYGGDFPELIVADGKRIWIHDEMLEQVTVKDQTQLATSSPLVLLTDLTRLDEQFEVRELGDFDGVQLLELRSRDTEAEFERVLLGLDTAGLRSMTLEDAFGFRTEIRFDALERNPELAPGLFEFSPPEGSDVIGDLPTDLPGS